MLVCLSDRVLCKAQDIVATVLDLFAGPATPAQAALADRFRADMRAEIAATGEKLPFWATMTQELLHCAETGDPLYFMRWSPIAGAMVPNTTPDSIRAYRTLRGRPDWGQRWRSAVMHPNFGHAPPFLANLGTSALTVGHASHLIRFQEATGQDLLNRGGIVEFGGGFGSMCRLTTRLGLPGPYLIFDLPPILALQRYYLGLHGIDAQPAGSGRVMLCRELDEVRANMPTNCALMSTWALSEMPLGLRERIETFLDDARATAVLLAYQYAFEGIDNRVWFDAMVKRHAAGWRWFKVSADSHSDYLFAVRP